VRALADFLKLVQNENMKIYRRVRTWIMLGFVLAVPLLVAAGIYASASGERPSNWFVMWLSSFILSYLIAVFTVVKAADSVAGEFSRGTIKLLLIRPWSRSAILLSKYLSVLLFGLALTVLSFVVTYLFSWLFFGSGGPSDGLPNLSGEAPLSYILTSYLYNFISLVVVASLAFMLSAAFQSSGLSIGLSIFVLLAGSMGIVNLILGAIQKPWIKFVIFPHLQLYMYQISEQGPVPNYDTSLGFSLAVLAGYFILFNVVSWTVFVRRDISA
jgi:ABC-2 type transport system permease protein